MVGVKWLRKCDVFVSQVAGISIHDAGVTGRFPQTPNNCVYAEFKVCMCRESHAVMDPEPSPDTAALFSSAHLSAHCFGFMEHNFAVFVHTRPGRYS